MAEITRTNYFENVKLRRRIKQIILFMVLLVILWFLWYSVFENVKYTIQFKMLNFHLFVFQFC